MKFSKTVVATACGLVAASAMAADVTVYGVLDQALTYTHTNKGVGSSFTLDSGNRWGSRFGFAVTEELTPGVSVVARLEAGFDSSNGKNADHDRLFNRESTLGLTGTYGTLKFGRAIAITSGVSPDSFLSKYVSTGTSYGVLDATKVVGNDKAFISNMVRYDTPVFSGAYGTFNASLQYSNALDGLGEPETGKASKDNRMYAVTFDYAPASWFKFGAGYEYVRANGMKELGLRKVQHPSRVFVGMHAFTDVYGGYAMFVHSEDVHELGSVKLLKGMHDGSSDAFVVGADYKYGNAKFMLTGGLSDGDCKYKGTGKKIDAKTYQVGAAVDYSLSKRTTLYGAAGYLKNKIKANGNSESVNTYQVMGGLTHSF